MLLGQHRLRRHAAHDVPTAAPQRDNRTARWPNSSTNAYDGDDAFFAMAINDGALRPVGSTALDRSNCDLRGQLFSRSHEVGR